MTHTREHTCRYQNEDPPSCHPHLSAQRPVPGRTSEAACDTLDDRGSQEHNNRGKPQRKKQKKKKKKCFLFTITQQRARSGVWFPEQEVLNPELSHQLFPRTQASRTEEVLVELLKVGCGTWNEPYLHNLHSRKSLISSGFLQCMVSFNTRGPSPGSCGLPTPSPLTECSLGPSWWVF